MVRYREGARSTAIRAVSCGVRNSVSWRVSPMFSQLEEQSGKETTAGSSVREGGYGRKRAMRKERKELRQGPRRREGHRGKVHVQGHRFNPTDGPEGTEN